MHTCMRTHAYMHTHTHTCTHINAHTHKYTHAESIVSVERFAGITFHSFHKYRESEYKHLSIISTSGQGNIKVFL